MSREMRSKFVAGQGQGSEDDSRDEAFTHDVFLSHSSRDKAVVRELAQRLKGDGVRVWFDEWEIGVGQSIPVRINEGLQGSRVLVLVMSQNAFGSEWATLETQSLLFQDLQTPRSLAAV